MPWGKDALCMAAVMNKLLTKDAVANPDVQAVKCSVIYNKVPQIHLNIHEYHHQKSMMITEEYIEENMKRTQRL